MSIPFFKTTITGTEAQHLSQLLANPDAVAKKEYIALCEKWFAENHGLPNFFLTKSCTDSLELAALTLNIQPGDEVIMPSYAFVSCANAFALRGAVCVFVDVHPNTMNLYEAKLEAAITNKTKAIVTVNYAGVGCNYEVITAISRKHSLWLVEDNAHGIGAKQNDRFLGTFGDISTFSFDHLKNVSCIQGGGIAINNPALLERFYTAYEFGTNRRNFFAGKADRYEWKSLGSNFPLSELSAAMLYAQLQQVEEINGAFRKGWKQYYVALQSLAATGKIELPQIPEGNHHSAHCFYIKTRSITEREVLTTFLHGKGINAQFHYTPLHQSEFGKTAGRFAGPDAETDRSRTLLRMPLYYSITEEEVNEVVEALKAFYAL